MDRIVEIDRGIHFHRSRSQNIRLPNRESRWDDKPARWSIAPRMDVGPKGPDQD